MLRENNQYAILELIKDEKEGSAMKMNDWNNNLQVRERMQNEALEYKLRETDPEQAKRDIASRVGI
jgi:hypothetical protein